MATLCRDPECMNAAKRDGLCWGHLWRRAHPKAHAPQALREYGLSPLNNLRKAAVGYRDVTAENDKAWRQADDLLRKAAEAYGRRKRKNARLSKRRRSG